MAYIPSYSSLPAPYPSFARTPGRNTSRAAKSAVYRNPNIPDEGSHIIMDPSGSGRSSSTVALQTFLKNKGYNIAVDGNRGPITNAAVAAYHNGVAPRVFNARGGSSGGRVVRNVSPGSRTPTPAPGGRTPPRVTPTRGTASVAAAAAPAPVSADMTAEQTVDAMMEAQYGPQIAALQRASAAAQAAGQANAAYLGRAYGEVGQTATQAGQLTGSSNAQLLAGADQAGTNTANLFGGPGANAAAGEAAAFSDINRGELAQLASSQQAFDTNMVPVIGAQGAQAQANALADAQAQMADYLSQIQGITAERGASRTSTLMGLNQQNLQNERDQQALDLARGLQTPKIQEAKANASLATQKANNFGNEFRLKLHNAGMSDKRTNAYINSTIARTNAMKAKAARDASGGIDYNDPNTITALQEGLTKSILGKKGGFLVHPGIAHRTLVAQLNSMFPKGVPQSVQALVGPIIEHAIAMAHNNGLWQGVSFNPKTGGIVEKGPGKGYVYNPTTGKREKRK